MWVHLRPGRPMENHPEGAGFQPFGSGFESGRPSTPDGPGAPGATGPQNGQTIGISAMATTAQRTLSGRPTFTKSVKR